MYVYNCFDLIIYILYYILFFYFCFSCFRKNILVKDLRRDEV